jgi:pyruvate/2-oxoglutarate/acetoin dehydrogenase E1 component
MTAATDAQAAAITEMTIAEAARLGLAEEMRRDPTVWALGEDLGPEGGVAGQYRGLQAEFGPRRIVDTPISESTIMGSAVGAALVGTRPVVELRYADFGICAADELVNQAAKNRYMFGGQGRVPLVVRQSIGVRAGIAAQHSQSTEAWWVHIPGLVVITPATPADTRGLLKSAIRCDDPVVFMEHKSAWDDVGAVDTSSDGAVPIGEGRIVRPGSDVTIVTWSRMVRSASEAAADLADRGIDAEVIDLRTLWPWDRELVFDSVSRTGRLIVTHESVQVGGFGAEIVAEVSEHLHGALRAPVRRLGAPRIPVPYSEPLEALVRVTPEAIVAAAMALSSANGAS